MQAHRRQLIALTILAVVLAAPSAYAQESRPQTAALEQQTAPPLRQEELDQLLAPIALYSDTLIAQVLMAATYPLEVVEADRWARAHPSLQGDALLKALEKERWDRSVKALVQVPTVLRMMSDKIEWTERLGNAFLAQQQDVVASIQRLRRMADNSDCRCLESNERQTVVRERDTIVIEQASPNVVYVPSYDTRVVYGAWPYPAYPPYYWPWDLYGGYGHYGYGGWPYAGPIFWGAGLFIAGALWHDHYVDWHGGYIGVGYHGWAGNHWRWRGSGWRSGAFVGDRWRHNSWHRRGVDYRDGATRRRFGGVDRTIADRNTLRARSGGRALDRRGVARLSNRDLSNGRNALGTRGQATDRFGTQRGGRDRVGTRGRGRDQLGTRGGSRNQFGSRTRGRDQLGTRGNRSQFGSRTRGRDQFTRGGAGNRDQFRGRSGRFGGASFRGGRTRGFDGVGRPGGSRSFGTRGGGNRGGMRGGRSGRGGRR